MYIFICIYIHSYIYIVYVMLNFFVGFKKCLHPRILSSLTIFVKSYLVTCSQGQLWLVVLSTSEKYISCHESTTCNNVGNIFDVNVENKSVLYVGGCILFTMIILQKDTLFYWNHYLKRLLILRRLINL